MVRFTLFCRRAGESPMSVFRTSNNTNAANNVDAPLREAYPINRAKEDDAVPDGPTEAVEERRRRRRERIVWLGVLLGVLALTIAAVAALASWRAITLVERTPAAGGLAVPPAVAAPVVTDFDVTYAQEALRVQVGCAAVLYIDLDEPRSNVDERISDLRYDSRCGQDVPRLTLGPGAAGGAQVRDADTDAAGCAKAIRTSPLGPGASAEVRKGTVLCVLTAGTPAALTLVEVTDVGRTGTAAMRATSWKVTG
jgi:hypothetical protein